MEEAKARNVETIYIEAFLAFDSEPLHSELSIFDITGAPSFASASKMLRWRFFCRFGVLFQRPQLTSKAFRVFQAESWRHIPDELPEFPSKIEQDKRRLAV